MVAVTAGNNRAETRGETVRLSKRAYEILLVPEQEAIQWMKLKGDEFRIMTGENLAEPEVVLSMIRFSAMVQFDCDTEEQLSKVLRVILEK